MQNLVVTINSVNYTSYLQGFSVIWPCTQAVPTATVTVDNTSGIFVNLPLKSAITITVNGTYIFNGVTENHPYALDKSYGHTVAIDCTSCYELTTLVEGSLQVVGTNLQVEMFGRYGQSWPYNVEGTTFTSSPSSGGSSFTVASTSGLVTGMNLQLSPGLPTTEFQTISTIVGNTITITSTLVYNHTSGDNVYGIFDYIPYPSVYAGTTLNAQLMDIGDVFKGLIHDPQPGQQTGYRGRLGYDVTGRGIATGSFDIANTGITNPPNYNGFELGLYVKGMWYCGPGSTGTTSATSGSGANTTSLTGSGREAFGIDLLKSLCQGNIMDTTGAPQFVDWFYKPDTNLIVYFRRGSQSSGVTFAIGTDQIQANNLPVDITDVKNNIVLWLNAEASYPADQDSWSNYVGTVIANTTVNGNSASGQKVLHVASTTGFLAGYTVNIGAGTARAESTVISTVGSGVLNLTTNLTYTHTAAQADTVFTYDIGTQWQTFSTIPASESAVMTTDSVVTFLGYGESNKYTATTTPVGGTVIDSDFTLLANGYQNLAPLDSLKNYRNLLSFNFDFLRQNVGASDDITVFLFDDINSKSCQFDASASMAAAGTWAQISIPIPNNPTTGHGVWTPTTTWDFSVNTITRVRFQMDLGTYSGANNIFWIDGIYFNDNYYYSPVYNNFGPYIGETNPLTGSPYTSGLEVTYDNNSIAAYGDRIYNWNDYYSSGNSDAAVGIAQNLLTSRRGKHAYGSFSVYNPPLGSIFPGYLINVTDAKDTYIGTTVDSTITAWFVEQIEYDYDMNNGFIGTYTVEPYYASFNGVNSPDTNARDPWSQYRKNPAYQRAYMNTKTRFTTSY